MPQATHAHTTGGAPAAPPPPPAACPVAPLAREAHRLYARYKANEAELELLRPRAGERLAEANGLIIREVYALEERACRRRATSAEGAMFQLATLAGIPLLNNAFESGRHAREEDEMLTALAYSVLGWMEEVSGLRREDVLGQSEFPREDDPHDALDEALGGRIAA